MRSGGPGGARAIALLSIVLLAGCTAGGAGPTGVRRTGGGLGSAAPPITHPGPVIRVASFDFPESELLAEMYGQALQAQGYPVSFVLGLGPREIAEPALEQGFVDLLPEYAGSALSFASLDVATPTANVTDTHALLAALVASRGMSALPPARAENQNGVVVTAETAARYHLATISELAPVAPTMVFGGPPECPQRPLCLLGLERVYGIRFKEFVPLDAAGPLTVDALRQGSIDAALLFTTDGAIGADGFKLLYDDQALQPAENVTPVVRRAVVQAYGPQLVAVINAVSNALTTEDLAQLNRRVTVDGQPAGAVARDWLERNGLGG